MLELNVSNLFNQHAVVAVNENVLAAGLISPTRAIRFSGDPQVDWGKLMNGFSYIDALNSSAAFAAVDTKGNPIRGLTLANRYGAPQIYQTARQLRFALRYTF